jgi:plasmid maintenance system antidote protein VapI
MYLSHADLIILIINKHASMQMTSKAKISKELAVTEENLFKNQSHTWLHIQSNRQIDGY